MKDQGQEEEMVLSEEAKEIALVSEGFLLDGRVLWKGSPGRVGQILVAPKRSF